MSLESVAHEVVGDYHQHVAKWQLVLVENVPGYQVGQTADDIEPDQIDWYDEICEDRACAAEVLLDILMFRIEAELTLPGTDAAEGAGHAE